MDSNIENKIDENDAESSQQKLELYDMNHGGEEHINEKSIEQNHGVQPQLNLDLLVNTAWEQMNETRNHDQLQAHLTNQKEYNDKLTCNCKVKACELCYQCSRCGCDHDGIDIEKSCQGKEVDQQAKDNCIKLHQRSNSVSEISQSDLQIDNEQEENEQYSFPQILSYFKFGASNIKNVMHNLPSLHYQSNCNVWNDMQIPKLKHVFGSVKFVLMEVFKSICGHSSEAAISAFNSFIKQNNNEKKIVKQMKKF